jgi:hypothetical protein
LAGLYNGFTAFLTELVLFIPNLIASLLILLIGYLIVRAVTKAMKWGLDKAQLEKYVGNTSLGRAVEKSGRTIGSITVSVVKWLMYLVVIVYAISALGVASLTASMEGILAWIPNLIGVAIIVFAGLLIGSYIGNALQNLLPKYGVGGSRLISIVVEALIYLFVFDLAIIQLGIGQGIVYVMTTALSWGLAAALAIGFGGALLYVLREVIPPMIRGSATIASTLRPGQMVSFEGIPEIPGNVNGGIFRGRVSNVGTFNTILERENGGFVVMPNSLLTDKPILVEGREAPHPFEDGVRERATDFNQKFEKETAQSRPLEESQSAGSTHR